MIPMFDAHCDTLSWLHRPSYSLACSPGKVDLERMKAFSPCAQFFAVYSNAKRQGPPMWDRFQAQMELFFQQMELFPDRVAHCTTAAQAEQAAREGKLAAFLSVEGAELLECSVDRLEQAYEMGVRAVNLTWNNANALSGTNSDCSDQGLSAQGLAFVRRMRELGMLVDVSHPSDPTFWDIVEKAPGPIFASHSNARAVHPSKRNLTDEQITAVIQSRGVIGLNLYEAFVGTKPTDVTTLVAHVEHILELGGEGTVALGGDWDGADPLVGGFKDIADWRILWEELLRRNYPESLVRDIFYNNLMRIVREVCDT
ncbi:MAG: membrane dipeptidase [Oscillospiraceae bacterium]|nr:membrane dipeptidase [Oscillospiraceae bacterium]MBO5917718.1 membrane dipeptidase [Oscillospiraceae bacterium]